MENPEPIQRAIDIDPTGYLVLLPSDAVNHVVRHHEWDGQGQRLAQPEDYAQLWRVLADGEIAQGVDSEFGQPRIIARLNLGSERFRAVFEARAGKNNRSMTLLSLVIKTGS